MTGRKIGDVAGKAVSAADVKRLAMAFPGVNEKPSHGRPAFFVGKKFFTRMRSEDGAIVMRVDNIEQRDMLLELDPETYFITPHYKDWSVILVRPSRIGKEELRVMLDRRFRAIAPKKLVAAHDGVGPRAKKPAAEGPAKKKRPKGSF